MRPIVQHNTIFQNDGNIWPILWTRMFVISLTTYIVHFAQDITPVCHAFSKRLFMPNTSKWSRSATTKSQIISTADHSINGVRTFWWSGYPISRNVPSVRSSTLSIFVKTTVPDIPECLPILLHHWQPGFALKFIVPEWQEIQTYCKLSARDIMKTKLCITFNHCPGWAIKLVSRMATPDDLISVADLFNHIE